MAELVRFFMTDVDERAFFRQLARHRLTLYPVRIPAGWKAPAVDESALSRLPEDAAYLAAEQLAPILVDRLKRGPDKGSLRVDEVRSPVIYYERSRINGEGELLSGKLWAELDITPQTGRRDAAPDRFRQLFREIQEWLHKTFRRGAPREFWVGPEAARRHRDGLVLRDSEHGGGIVRPFR